LISHLEETQLISAQGSTNLIQPRTESKSMLVLIITLMIDFIHKSQVCLFLHLLLLLPEHFPWKLKTTDSIFYCCSLLFCHCNSAPIWASQFWFIWFLDIWDSPFALTYKSLLACRAFVGWCICICIRNI
jgi:hypothetical protein